MTESKKIFSPSSVIRHPLFGWRRNMLAFALGICATLTLAPFFIFPLIIPAFAGLFLLIDLAPSRKRAFWDGWWWGWGFYISGLYWICIALLTDAEHFGWLLPFTLFGVTAVIAIYCGLACALTAWTGLRGWQRIFVFSAIWSAVEFARGHLFSGFPWNLQGYSFGFSLAGLQLASLVGVYGLTWFAVLLGSSFAALIGFGTQAAPEAASPRRVRDSGFGKGKVFVVIVWIIFFISLAWGQWRLYEADQVPQSERTVPGVLLRLVQADIAQFAKWDPKTQMQGLREQIRLTQSPGLDKVTHIIWPETAVPFALEAGSPLVRQLRASIPDGKILITGALRLEGDEADFKVWNSLMAIDHAGNIVGSYDKSKLVPFGEFLPFRRYLPKAWTTPVGDKDFSRGGGTRTLEWPGLPPISPLICYEVIFPGRVTDLSQPPQLLLNVTNDGWFGMSTGPYQHFEMSRMRAVEEGIPLVRVANTGITAEIDSYGRIIASLPLGEKGVIDIELYKSQLHATTYSIDREWFLYIIWGIAIFMIILRQKKANN